jgi:diguanylate cyclase (GGDEF)-like protein
MLEWWKALNSGMSRRLLRATSLALGAVLLAVVVLVSHEERQRHDRSSQTALDRTASLFAGATSARLAAAEEIARTLTSDDSGSSGPQLRSRVKNGRVFSGVFLLDPDADGQARAGAYEFRFSRAQLGTMLSGGSALLTVPLDTQITGIILARSVTEQGVARIAAFELSPDWLWSPLQDLPAGLSLVALNADGVSIHGSGEVAPELGSLLATGLGGTTRGGISRRLAWQSRGVAWEGSLVKLVLADAATSPPFAVVVASRHPGFWARFDTLTDVLPWLLLLCAGAVVVLPLNFARHYLPTLRGLDNALTDLSRQQLTPLRAPHGDRELGDVVESYNQAASTIARQLATLRAQMEIDELLLGAAELEGVLDQVLVRLRDVMCARAVGITLIDADATGYGRLFVASNDNVEWPVSRVPLDSSVVELFSSAPDGLTIARCEEDRHSFLIPLTRVGAQFFWAWPVFAGERLAAILAVGYGEAPRLDARLAGHGTDCAHRLGTVLSRGARADRLYRQAHFDALTQLPNRLLFRDRLEQAISSAATASSRGALLYIDLDHFKKVNDSLGHAAGDQLLSIVGQRLRACVKEGDTVARLAGDEFTVILHQVSEPGAARVVAQRVIESLQMPVNLGGRDHQVRASIGITLFPDDGASIDELMRNADLAMYRAKDQGRGAAVFFDRNMMTRTARVPDTGLYRALKRREFALFYQPQYNVADGSLVGVEALLRWDSPRGGMRSPAEFVPAAEECGLIVDIGSWVLDAACAQLASWRQHGLPLPRIAVNISAQQLHEAGFVMLVKRMLDKYALPADMLELELTESAFTDPEAEVALQGLARLGVGLALDDFGTGYSALNHLRRYPVRTVKIDRSFIDGVADNAASATMAEAIIAMAHTLGKQVVAEGVETAEQLEFLRERGCDLAQGYYLARPLPAAGMAELLAARQPDLDEEETAAAG